MKLNTLTIKDKALFNRYLNLAEHELSTYAFENIYIWQGLFDIKWREIEDALCIFFQDKCGLFLYLSPLSKHKNPRTPEKIFEILDRCNKNKEISRIENIEASDVSFYRDLGFECTLKFHDYLCQRRDLVKLQGNKFKPKRASHNYFIKHYEFECLPFSLKFRDDCLKLYSLWMRQRSQTHKDRIYRGMLADSQVSLKKALANYSRLDLVGCVVRINREVRAFSFGFKLNKDTFCILYEITDLSIKGLAQFIFRQFCSELKGYKYINIMDDSGLDNLKKAKLSYQPIRLIPAYIARIRG